ncbi:H-2 class II histocompatibility antigen, I-E beta chain-like [Crotalus tigris]|uniref:H-2 class II histocompatibility antigen, I-E beta chain-like n=1 Tax=Crotalus tigris TaxID=88082 RepID=UPI00192F3B0C|nr:H-2 class II histocompatibility antigen, I-E beta chain-like [Crotalus tigris]
MGSAGLPLMLLLAGALARIPGSEAGKETPVHFLYQTKHECSFINGTRRVRFLQRYIYDREEYLRFDSARGEFEAVTALGKVDARAWNRNQRLLLDAKASVDYFCRANCEALQGGAVIGRRDLSEKLKSDFILFLPKQLH